MWTTSNQISKELEDFWQDSQSLMQQWQVQADIDMRMLSGQQNPQTLGLSAFGIGYTSTGTGQVQDNRLLRIVNMIGGYQRDNRLATVCIPADNDIDNGETAEQLTTVMDWVCRRDYTYEKISEAFEGAISCGLNLLHTWVDFREDPENGEIRVERIPYSAFLMSPYWTKSDLSDCERIWTRKYLSKDQVTSLLPKLEKDLPTLGRGYSAKDGKFQFMPQNFVQYQNELYSYDEYWVKDYKTGRKILDISTGEVADWFGNRDQFQMLKRINPNVKMIKAKIPTIKLHILVNDNLVYEEKTPWGLDRLPFVPVICYHYPEVQDYSYRYQGVVRPMRGLQIDLNLRSNAMRDVLDAQVQSGVLVKEDALVNPDDAFLQGPGRVLYFKRSANLQSDVVIVPPPPVAPGWMEFISSIQKEIMDIIGPEELFAQNLGAQEQMSGVLMKLKMGAGLTGLRNIFDRLNQSQMILGEIVLDLITNNFSAGKIQAILGKQPSQILSEATMPDKQLRGISRQFLKYNCAVEEAELTSTQRQLQFLQAIQLKQLGVPIPNKYILEKSTLQGKKQVMDAIQEQEMAQQQMQMAQAQAELQQSQMVARSLEAKAQSDFGRAIESRSRAVSDEALAKERAAQASHDLAKTALDNVKALKELEEIDEDRLVKLTDYILNMQMRQQALAGGEEGDSISLAEAVGMPVEQVEEQTRPQEQASI